jgi:hypothetical protein
LCFQIESQCLTPVAPKLAVLKDTAVRKGPELDSKWVEIKDGKKGMLEAGKTIESLELVVLPDGTERVRYEAGWVSTFVSSDKRSSNLSLLVIHRPFLRDYLCLQTVQTVDVVKDTPVREGADMDSKKVQIKGGKDGKLEAGKTIEILESVVLPDVRTQATYSCL